jgi:hypothetical protein
MEWITKLHWLLLNDPSDYRYARNNNNNNNNKNNNNNMKKKKKCRQYQLFNETKDHIISTCPTGAKEQHKHDTIYAHVHFNICKERVVKLDN